MRYSAIRRTTATRSVASREKRPNTSKSKESTISTATQICAMAAIKEPHTTYRGSRMGPKVNRMIKRARSIVTFRATGPKETIATRIKELVGCLLSVPVNDNHGDRGYDNTTVHHLNGEHHLTTC